jgi:hypothetical protein
MYGTDVFSMLFNFLLFGTGLTIVSGRSLGISFPLTNIKFLLVKGSSSTKFSSQNLNRSSVLLIITFFPIIARSIALLRTPISASHALFPCSEPKKFLDIGISARERSAKGPFDLY